MNVTSVNTPMSRDDVLKTFAPLLQSFGQGPTQVATRAEAAEQAKARDIVERAASYTVESIIKSLAELQVNLGGAIDSLADRLEQEASKLGELRHALASEGRRLHELRNTRVAAEALEILIQDHKKKVQVLDDKAASERHELEDKIGKQRDAWAREQAERAAALAESEANLAKERRAKEEQYTYEIERQRKLSADEYAEKKRLLERGLAEAGAAKGKNWGEREQVLTAATGEIEALRARVEGLPRQLEEESKKARERAIGRITGEAKHEAELLEKESAANIQVFELKIKSIEERIARQVAQIADLQKQLVTALEQTQILAQKAIEGTSGGKK
jgi:DNA repair exonuclease SbcCD ATPase subunit